MKISMDVGKRLIKLFEWLAVFKFEKCSVDNPLKRFRNLFLETSVAIDTRIRAVYPKRFTLNLDNRPFKTLQACNIDYHMDRRV